MRDFLTEISCLRIVKRAEVSLSATFLARSMQGKPGQSSLFLTYMTALGELKAPSDTLNKSYAENSALVGTYCAPKGVILDQVTDVFCQYLSANPAERHKSANYLLVQALNKAWPCK
jgi:hypothetical protein